MNQMSFEYFQRRYFEAINLTYLSRLPSGWNWHLFTPFYREEIGCQGFIGPLPSAFLDKCPGQVRDVKNCHKDKRRIFRCPNIFVKNFKTTGGNSKVKIQKSKTDPDYRSAFLNFELTIKKGLPWQPLYNLSMDV